MSSAHKIKPVCLSRSIALALAVYSLIAAYAPLKAQPTPTVQSAQFDAYVETAMATWGVPGVAVALVRDGKILSVKGYGVRTIGRTEPVDGNTVFAIASLTKAFTAAGVAVLVDEGKLSFDDPVVKYLPALKLYDPAITKQVTIRDLLGQRTCLQSKDLLTWNSPFSRDETLRRLAFLPPACSFRDRFVYNNLNFVLAGEAAAAAGGRSWSALMSSRLFGPLGMTNTTATTPDAATLSNVATPYLRTGGKLRALPLYDEGVSAPAGSIHSTAADMARWLEAQIGGGSFGGKLIWSPVVQAEMQGSQMAVQAGARHGVEPPLPISRNYGFGWGLGEYRGRRLVDHSGQSDGMYALAAMMPNERLGIVVLTNSSMVGLPEALAYRWFDDNLGVAPFDWITTLYDRAKSSNDAIDIDAVTKGVPRKLGTRPSLPADCFVGTYSQKLLGGVTVRSAGAGPMTVQFLAKTGRLSHWQDNMYQIDWGGDPYYTMVASFMTFIVAPGKGVTSMKIGGDDEMFERATPLSDRCKPTSSN